MRIAVLGTGANGAGIGADLVRGESLIVQNSPRLGTRLGVPMPSTAIGRTTEVS